MQDAYQTRPAREALAVTYDATISSSTTVTLNASTNYIEVTAIDKAILMAWNAAASTSNFDAVIPANSTRLFKRPVGVTTVHFLEQAATAILTVVEM